MVPTHPEVKLQVSTASELSVADLERDRHLIVRMQRLVKAFARMRLHLDIVRMAEAEAGEDGQEQIHEDGHSDVAPGAVIRWSSRAMSFVLTWY